MDDNRFHFVDETPANLKIICPKFFCRGLVKREKKKKKMNDDGVGGNGAVGYPMHINLMRFIKQSP